MLKQELQQKQSLSPKQILEATLLQLNNSNLEKYILEEFERNPILEPTEIINNDETGIKESLNYKHNFTNVSPLYQLDTEISKICRNF